MHLWKTRKMLSPVVGNGTPGSKSWEAPSDASRSGRYHVEMLEERYPKAIKQVFNVDKTKLNDDYLKEMVQAIRKNRFFSAVEVESMEELAEIYYKRDLSYHRNAYDSFYHVTAENRSQL